MWKQWMTKAESLVLLPKDLTQDERALSYKACNMERSLHGNIVRRQHLFTVNYVLEASSCAVQPLPFLLCRLCSWL